MLLLSKSSSLFLTSFWTYLLHLDNFNPFDDVNMSTILRNFWSQSYKVNICLKNDYICHKLVNGAISIINNSIIKIQVADRTNSVFWTKYFYRIDSRFLLQVMFSNKIWCQCHPFEELVVFGVFSKGSSFNDVTDIGGGVNDFVTAVLWP